MRTMRTEEEKRKERGERAFGGKSNSSPSSAYDDLIDTKCQPPWPATIGGGLLMVT